jgi:hypothetical protein
MPFKPSEFPRIILLRTRVNRARDGERHSCPVVVEPLISVVLVFPCFYQLAENATYIFVEVFCYFLLHILRHQRPCKERCPSDKSLEPCRQRSHVASSAASLFS